MRLTIGLENPNSIKQLSDWLESETDAKISDLRKDTVAYLLKNQVVTGDAERMLEIRQELGKTSTKKYDAIEAAVCADGRVRGLLQFYGANRTGRWAGRLVQVQNLPRTHIEQLDIARSAVRRQEAEKLKFFFGSIPDTLSQLIRTSFIASPGHHLVDADFSSIEARVISWLAGEHWRLEVFKTHGKIYEASASQMFGVPIEKIKKGNPEYSLRQRGKVAELALGYQGSTGALITMGALDMGLAEDELPNIVSRWRESNKRIVELWYKMESAAVSVIQNGVQAGVNNLLITREFDAEYGLDFMTITLPSSRKLYYARPSLGVNQWGRPSITYQGVDQTTKQWKMIETYGGKLVENVVQAIARDCLAVAIERLEAAGFPVVFHVHDEVVIDCPVERANLDEVTRLMAHPIPWAENLPLGADGWVGEFFRKD
jgi:DNA polymerase